MIRKIGGTILTRFLTLLGAFLIVVLNTNTLGKEGQGTIALINFGILCILALSNYIGGGAVVYLTPRLGIKNLVLPAYIWSALVGLLIYFGLVFTPLANPYLIEMTVLAFLHGLFGFHMQVLIGKERIKSFNALQVIQVFSLLLFMVFFYWVQKQGTVDSFIYSMFGSFALVFACSLAMVIRYFKSCFEVDLLRSFREILNYSKYAQTANVLQILNYRLNFLLMEKLILGSRGAIGIYSVGMYVSEAVWNVSKSLSMVQYSRISNVENAKYNQRLTRTFFKVSMAFTACVVVVLLSLPEGVYTFVFGDTFIGIKEVLYFIAPGILFNSGSVIISHYFSGVGKYKYNTLASAIGLTGTLVFGYLLITSMELSGASITFSIAMFAQFLFLMFLYGRESEARFKDLLINKQDVKLIRDQLFKK